MEVGSQVMVVNECSVAYSNDTDGRVEVVVVSNYTIQASFGCPWRETTRIVNPLSQNGDMVAWSTAKKEQAEGWVREEEAEGIPI